jgi:hypothetical protein
MANIEISDLNEDIKITEDELKHVKGGLLPAYDLSTYKLSTTYHKLGSQVIEGVFKF